jgi:hypothetical protein
MVCAATSNAAIIAGEYNGVRILEPGSTVAGKSIGEWGGEWWRWVLGQSTPGDALTDTTGANAGVNQAGPVFFVAGSAGGPVERSFTVPKDKYLLFPLVNVLTSTNEGVDENDLISDTSGIADLIDSWTFSIDGIDVSAPGAGLTALDLSTFREASPGIFDIVQADPNVFGNAPGAGRAFSDGYYVMVEPIDKGATHQFIYGGGVSSFDFTTEAKATIAVPSPTVLPLFGAGVLGLLIIRLGKLRRA